ncbi:DNA polymerase III subunit delta [Flavobacteriaceae bacterium]|jgi:DNA polymerase-3 subunit delta|nr:DNA polymerase III subunit delta [Flavobacteriaceae bacterium]MDA9879507.1 DNA polymerase III subunit delta [Flavobacteriaceae bacterium]
MQAFFTLLSKIEKQQFSPFYLLSGTESYYIDAVLAALISKLVDESSRDFDFTLFFGKEASSSEIIETAKRYPMMAEFNVVVVKEAQLLLPSALDELANYAAHPMNKSVLILCYMHKAFDKRKKLYKAVEKNGEILTVKPLYDNQIPQWVRDHAKALQLELTPTAVELISSYVGSNLTQLSNELKKLKLTVKVGELIDEESIERYVGISKAFNSFELQKAVGSGNFSLAFQIVKYLNLNPKSNPLVLTLSSLHSYFQKLLLLKGIENKGNAAASIGVSPYFIKEYEAAAKRFSMRQISQAMKHIFEADLKSKGISGASSSDTQILETLLIQLFTL